MSKAKRFDRALEKLLADRSPRREASNLDREEQHMLRVAQLLRGSRGLAEGYAEGLWDTPDLVALIRLAARNARLADKARRRLLPLLRPVQVARGLTQPASRRRRRRAAWPPASWVVTRWKNSE